MSSTIAVTRCFPRIQPTGIPMAVYSRFYPILNRKGFRKPHFLRFCSANTSDNTNVSVDFGRNPIDKEGILSYGLLNTAYYLTTFLVVWFYITPTPGRMGYFTAVERFLKVMAMVWAGSQVTKLLRAGGALVLAPFVDRGLSWITVKFKFESQGKAFMAIAGFCFGLAFLMFLVVTILSA